MRGREGGREVGTKERGEKDGEGRKKGGRTGGQDRQHLAYPGWLSSIAVTRRTSIPFWLSVSTAGINTHALEALP